MACLLEIRSKGLVDAVRIAELDEVLDLAELVELRLSLFVQTNCIQHHESFAVGQDGHRAANGHCRSHAK